MLAVRSKLGAQVRELIYREILEYHPHMLADYLNGARQTNFMYPSAVDSFRRQFAHLEGGNTGRQQGLGQVRALSLHRLPDLLWEQVVLAGLHQARHGRELAAGLSCQAAAAPGSAAISTLSSRIPQQRLRSSLLALPAGTETSSRTTECLV